MSKERLITVARNITESNELRTNTKTMIIKSMEKCERK